MSFKRAGPFPVVKRIRSSVYEFKIPQTWKSLHPVINEFKLKPYHYPTRDFINTKSSTIQEVKDILDSRRQGNELQYLAKWTIPP